MQNEFAEFAGRLGAALCPGRQIEDGCGDALGYVRTE